MIGVDTNVLIRYLVQDGGPQARAAERFIDTLTRDEPGFVSLVALAEVAWVLKSVYRLPKDEILPIIDGMLATEELRLQQPDQVRQAVASARNSSADFADALIGSLAAAADCEYTVTFDLAASKLVSMKLLKTR